MGASPSTPPASGSSASRGVKPFVVQNLGKYERQAWQAAEFGENAAALTQSYRDFILDLYRARPLHGYAWLHGVKNGRMVYVGGVDSPVSTQDVAQITAEFHRLTGTGKDAPTQSSIDILGWDFAFEINEVARQQAVGVGIDVHFVRIPREVLEKKAVEQGDIKFFELAALSVDVTESGRGVTLALKDFVIPLDDVPQEVQAGDHALGAVDRLLGRGLGQQGGRLPQSVAVLPDAQGQDPATADRPRRPAPTKSRANIRWSSKSLTFWATTRPRR